MTKPAHILFLDSNHPLLQQELEKAGFVCHLHYDWSRERVLKELENYDGIVLRSRIKIDKELIDRGRHLRFIARAGAGMENIDVPYAGSKGIDCLNSPEGNRDAVAEHSLGMLLALLHNLTKADREVRLGKWLREENRGVELNGKTVGIIGYGNTGSAFARLLGGFGVTVLAYDKYKHDFSGKVAKESTMEELFQRADIISLHIPLTDETRYLVQNPFLQKFKKSIYIINTSRGQIVKTDDLVAQLRSGKILGACLDVLEYESSSFESLTDKKMPEPLQYLLRSERVVLTPHIAGWTHESNRKMAQALAEKIRQLYRK